MGGKKTFDDVVYPPIEARDTGMLKVFITDRLMEDEFYQCKSESCFKTFSSLFFFKSMRYFVIDGMRMT